MTCKDCLYWERCYSRISYVMDYDEIGKEITDIENHCKGFVDKSRYAEVVRCKDCRYSDPYLHYFYCENDNAPWAENTMANIVDAKDFCSYGERKCEDA